MGNTARKARKKLQQNLRTFGQHEAAAELRPEREPKRPTSTHLTKKEQQEKRRRARKIDAKVEALAAKVGVAMGKELFK